MNSFYITARACSRALARARSQAAPGVTTSRAPPACSLHTICSAENAWKVTAAPQAHQLSTGTAFVSSETGLRTPSQLVSQSVPALRAHLYNTLLLRSG